MPPELVRKGAGLLPRFADADPGEQLDGTLVCLLPRHAQMQAERFAQLCPDRLHRIQCRHRVLVDQTDILAAQGTQPPLRHAQQLGATEADRTTDGSARHQEADDGQQAELLPEPDSPTRPSVWRFRIAKPTPLTAASSGRARG